MLSANVNDYVFGVINVTVSVIARGGYHTVNIKMVYYVLYIIQVLISRKFFTNNSLYIIL